MRQKTYKITLTGILAAAALSLSFLESLLPAVAFLPPGAKLGLSNITVMFAVSALPLPYALGIVILKALFAALRGGMTPFMLSFCGGFASLAVLYIAHRFMREWFGIIGISVLSAVMHNTAQLVAACLLTSFNIFVPYLPFLLFAGLGAGFITGIVYSAVNPYLMKIKNKM